MRKVLTSLSIAMLLSAGAQSQSRSVSPLIDQLEKLFQEVDDWQKEKIRPDSSWFRAGEYFVSPDSSVVLIQIDPSSSAEQIPFPWKGQSPFGMYSPPFESDALDHLLNEFFNLSDGFHSRPHSFEGEPGQPGSSPEEWMELRENNPESGKRKPRSIRI